jgi:hypothetical protein
MTDDPSFYAWLDGELAEPEASAMAARVARDPELSALADQHRALGARLHGAFATVAEAPVPERLRAALTLAPATEGAEVIDLAAARERRRRWSLTGLAMAASLALGLTMGVLLPTGSETGGSYRAAGAKVLAAGTLDQALDRQSAAAGELAGVRIGLTFRDSGGRFCRTFTAATDSGLACRADGDWQIEGLVRGQAESGDYRMASGFDPLLGTMVDSRLAGDPLEPEQEAEVIRRGWKD